jgi:hypothetical protein
LEIVTDTITTFGQCRRCNVFFDEAGLNQKIYQKEVEEYPKDFIQEFQELSNWIKELKKLYKHRLFIKLIDVKSFVGIYKSLRHRIRKYPTFIVEGQETYTGWDKGKLEGIIDKYIHASYASKYRPIQSTLS